MPREVSEQPEAIGHGVPDALGRERHRLVPADAREPRLARPPEHRVGEPSELAQLPAVAAAEGRDVAERVVGHPRHRVELEQVQPGRAQVDAVEGPVVQAGDAERTAVAHPAGQDARGVPELLAVLGHGAEHLAVVVRLVEPDPVRSPADPLARAEPGDVEAAPQRVRGTRSVGHRSWGSRRGAWWSGRVAARPGPTVGRRDGVADRITASVRAGAGA
jgi:hypothetical protein